MLAKYLDGLNEKYPDCILSAYGDIGTGVTLVTRSRQSVPREALDELCAEAALTLGPTDAPPLGPEPCGMAIKALDHAFYVYLRAPDEPTDALLFMCNHSIDLAAFIADARALFDLAAEGAET